MWTHFGSLPGPIPGYPLGELFIIASWGYTGRPWRLYGSSTLPLGKAEKCLGTLQEVWKGFRVGGLPSWLVQLSWYAPLAWSVYQLGGPPPRRYNLWHKDPGGHPEFPPLSSLANPEYPIGQPWCTWLANQIWGMSQLATPEHPIGHQCALNWPTRFEGCVHSHSVTKILRTLEPLGLFKSSKKFYLVD